MWQLLVENIAAPLARRAGTTAAGLAAMIGASGDVVNAVDITVVFLVGYMIDLAVSKSSRIRFRIQILQGVK